MTKLVSTLVALFGFWGIHWIPPLSLVKPFCRRHYGLHWNWIWAIDCGLMALFLSRYWTLRLDFWPKQTDRLQKLVVLSLLLGLGIQAIFYVLKLRDFHFRGFSFETLLFQALVSFTEEMFHRGILQHRLARAWRPKIPGAVAASLAAALTISLAFGFMHGLNPVLLHRTGFDISWAFSSFLFSMVAGTLYAWEPSLIGPVLFHFTYNVVATFF